MWFCDILIIFNKKNDELGSLCNPTRHFGNIFCADILRTYFTEIWRWAYFWIWHNVPHPQPNCQHLPIPNPTANIYTYKLEIFAKNLKSLQTHKCNNWPSIICCFYNCAPSHQRTNEYFTFWIIIIWIIIIWIIIIWIIIIWIITFEL